MLANQTFAALPLVVIGPELFYDADHALYFNLDRIFTFRQRIENFIFLFCALEDSKYGNQNLFYKRLVGMGVPLQEKIIVKKSVTNDPALRENVGKLFLNADLIFSPEFVNAFTSQGVPFTNRRNYEKYSAVFVGALIHFSESMEPFSIDAFTQYFNNQLPAHPIA